MRTKVLAGICVVSVVLGILLATAPSMAQQTRPEEAAFSAGSLALSVLYFPLKLTTCLGTQTGVAFAYVLTYGVPGNYDGGTNGRQLGEVARSVCVGPWIISPDQVKEDYGPTRR